MQSTMADNVSPSCKITLAEAIESFESKVKANRAGLQKKIDSNKKKPCEKEYKSSKIKSKSRQPGCSIENSRQANLRESHSNEFILKLLARKKENFEKDQIQCPRQFDEYEKRLRTPICVLPTKSYENKILLAISSFVCVFCLGNLYTGGCIVDLFTKVSNIRKQSEINGDQVSGRIGIRTRITVHRKCYVDYIDYLTKGKGKKADGKSRQSSVSSSEKSLCGDNEDGSEESNPEGNFSSKKQNFCLRKPKYLTANLDLTIVSKMGKFKPHGLVADLWPNIRLLQLSGHFLHEYHDDNSAMNVLLRKIYSSAHLILVFVHFAAIIANLAMEADDVNILAANSITVLFFAHCVTKFCYFALRRHKFYRTLAVWDTQNSHPLFAESHARHRALAITKSRRLLMITVIGTLLTVVGWTGSTFFGDSIKTIPDPDNNNETITVEIPRLMLRAWYPWDASSGTNYMISFVYQLYWLIFTLFHANLVDLLFCCWLIFACEQLLHVKEIMKPLIDLSSSLDTYNPGSADLFKAASTIDDNVENMFDSKEDRQINIRGIYSNMRDFGMNRNNVASTISTVNGIGPNGLTKKHEMLVRSAIKYWVERHKHIVRYVGSIGEAYGLALLLHMLTSTITLTLLAYQATKIDGMDLYAMAVLGYLFYSLAQVFAFCIYGNQLIEESSSVMEAAYSCQWYDGSEEAKTFVQIVCQQCQKALSVSGAKFFTVSLDLFASVLGAVVTYFMVLVQLK